MLSEDSEKEGGNGREWHSAPFTPCSLHCTDSGKFNSKLRACLPGMFFWNEDKTNCCRKSFQAASEFSPVRVFEIELAGKDIQFVRFCESRNSGLSPLIVSQLLVCLGIFLVAGERGEIVMLTFEVD